MRIRTEVGRVKSPWKSQNPFDPGTWPHDVYARCSARDHQLDDVQAGVLAEVEREYAAKDPVLKGTSYPLDSPFDRSDLERIALSIDFGKLSNRGREYDPIYRKTTSTRTYRTVLHHVLNAKSISISEATKSDVIDRDVRDIYLKITEGLEPKDVQRIKREKMIVSHKGRPKQFGYQSLVLTEAYLSERGHITEKLFS